MPVHTLLPAPVAHLINRWLPVDDLRRRRLIAMVRGSSSSLLSKLLAVLISFISIPLTIGYLGIERYGAWITIASVMTWMQLSDLGLGQGLTNAITADLHRNRPDLVRMHLSNFVALVTGLAALIGGLLASAWPWIHWGKLLGVTRPETIAEVHAALATAVVLFLER